MREEIVMSWDEWKASRAAKRANLRRLGLDAPSRRMTDYGTDGLRLRKAFGGLRAPERFQVSSSFNPQNPCNP